ncbi:hypothetical protein GGI21_001037 [Coemansia aciculifera]|uniref:Uncharacterized protein n=1 Tax=Coemansia aciculifera TaxID=417176 RepID=A0ACC1M9K1_9FUNG|nr:hypothetical protein IWW38_000460 [Coemansia aciculifera]KAJ2910274.1 hypothetical protein GGI21_001037 [Coemansia aciculifera]
MISGGGLAILRRQPWTRAAALTLRSGRANYTVEKKVREQVKFPWIWPSEASKTPQRAQYLPRLDVYGFIQRFVKSGLRMGARGQASLVFSDEYIEGVTGKMVGVVLQRTVDAINACDYDALSQLMIPPVAKVYKHSLANMKAQGYTLRINLVGIESSAIEDVVLYLGKPESFDMSVPVDMRANKYAYWFNDSMAMSFPKKGASKNMEMVGLPTPSVFLESLADDGWRSVQYRFNVRTDVEVTLESRGKCVDLDRGMMDIPLALNSPFYEGLSKFRDAVKHGENSPHLEPFRWYVGDLFNIAEQTEHTNIKKLISKTR